MSEGDFNKAIELKFLYERLIKLIFGGNMIKNIVVEKLNGHDKESAVGKCYKEIGDIVSVGETIFSVESGKGSFQIKSVYAGRLLTLDISEGEKVKKGQVVGTIEAKEGEEAETKKQGYNFGISKPIEKILEVDVLVIGGGPGGYVSAIRSAQNGFKTAIVEADRLGGTCLNRGCIPTKAMISSVSLVESLKQAESFGIQLKGYDIHFEQMMERKNQVVNQLVSGVEHLMEANEITFINGKAEVVDENLIKVNTKKFNYDIHYKNLIIATGSKVAYLPIEGADQPDILTSTELLELKEIPKSLTIIGGGVIGMEFAFIYNALGTQVNVIEFAPQILGLLDEDVVEIIKTSAKEKGIQIYEGAKAVAIKETLDGEKLLEVERDGNSYSICSQKIAMAVGRRANLEGLDLPKLGVQLNERKNGIAVNQYMQTNCEHIYGIGDITNIIQLAHVASHQGIVAADHIAGKMHEMDYNTVPSAIFTMPEVGHIGLSEKEAKAQNRSIKVSVFPFMANGKALAMGETEGFVKLIADATSLEIIGGIVVGPHGTDLMAVISNLVMQKTTVNKAANVIYAHPTTAESIHESILMLEGKGIHFA